MELQGSRVFSFFLNFFPLCSAVKVNDSAAVLETLATLGAGFDCASKGLYFHYVASTPKAAHSQTILTLFGFPNIPSNIFVTA